MIPRALNAPLSWIGLMRVSEHEAVRRSLAESEMLCHSLDAERNELIDLAAGRLEVINRMATEINSLSPDALLWRAARLKRRGNK